MAVLQKMRDKFGILISVIIALSLLYFIAPMDDLMTLFGRPQNVGEIAGKGISYEDFQAEVENLTTVNEIVSGSSLQNEETQKKIRDNAWKGLVDKYLFIRNARAAGIRVGTDEVVELTTGDNPSPVIAGNPAFTREDGSFDRESVVDFVQNLDEDNTGRLRVYWQYLQNSVLTQSYYAKYMSLFCSSNFENDLMKEYDVTRGNTTVDVDYVMASYPWQRDTTIKVDDAEIKAYYANHKQDFKRPAGRNIEYVVYEVVPSEADINLTRESFSAVYDEFTTTENVKSFLLKNSETPYSEHWYKDGELASVNKALSDFVSSAATGEYSGIIEDDGSFYAGRVTAVAEIPEAVYVKHILLQGSSAQVQADSLRNVVKGGENFANLVAQFSVDKGSSADGELGNIGWLSQSNMIPGFESVFTARVGEPFVIKTQYGYHVVVVSDTRDVLTRKQVAVLSKTTIPGKETYNDFYGKASAFASLAGGTCEGFRKAADSLNVYAYSLKDVHEGETTFGAVEDAREVSRWIFDNRKGKASQIISVNNKYFVIVAVTDAYNEGYASVAEVSGNISNVLYAEKMRAKVCRETAAKIDGQSDLETIAGILNSSVETKTAASVSVRESVLDASLAGAAVYAEVGKICGPVAGRSGVYVFRVNDRQNGSFFTDDDAVGFNTQKSQYSTQMVVPVMMRDADVKDNRARYY